MSYTQYTEIRVETLTKVTVESFWKTETIEFIRYGDVYKVINTVKFENEEEPTVYTNVFSTHEDARESFQNWIKFAC